MTTRAHVRRVLEDKVVERNGKKSSKKKSKKKEKASANATPAAHTKSEVVSMDDHQDRDEGRQTTK